MFARSSTIQAQRSSIDAGIEHMRDQVMPALAEVPGWIGLSLLVDRDSGRCIVTTAWETEAALHDSADRVRPIRYRAAAIFGSGDAQVEEWEIAVLHRDHPAPEGACARVTWARTSQDRLDAAIDGFRDGTLPRMEALDGFSSASLLVDRATGRCVSCSSFDSAEAMDRNRTQATDIRTAATQQAGVQVTEVSEFELALAHLRVPELV
ncbi:antibiotic biosynthesis monooxygenase [Nocardia seriolae]|uniref:ABM domain-containing protein n=2 Tax=Nocardia seriolae TaxID=37332 RepID=A0ABC8AYP9_9NOCA|nr:antibiotic biosynthesis monooxygenase [Nocardia seriolae]APA99348.1 uncharacterized protein NS506_05302 [Nocardia seriolae]MTJ63263.1 hypothetical protein [Nocardia seriolae]MTJ72200.1 hypothetical protein [Nocardia seriolae]MTK32914.1 hypothetical protein [Nocardia seriolae]MTK41155.1 hypothetical protein [Nocardia seriolae]